MPPEGCEHPLHQAAMQGDAAEVARLLAAGEDPNATNAQVSFRQQQRSDSAACCCRLLLYSMPTRHIWLLAVGFRAV